MSPSRKDTRTHGLVSADMKHSPDLRCRPHRFLPLLSPALRPHQLEVGCGCSSESPHVAYLFPADGDASVGPCERRSGRRSGAKGLSKRCSAGTGAPGGFALRVAGVARQVQNHRTSDGRGCHSSDVPWQGFFFLLPRQRRGETQGGRVDCGPGARTQL